MSQERGGRGERATSFETSICARFEGGGGGDTEQSRSKTSSVRSFSRRAAAKIGRPRKRARFRRRAEVGGQQRATSLVCMLV